MKILVIGSGGREHAIITSLKKSPKITEIHSTPGNAGIAETATCHNVKATDIDGIIKLAKELNIDSGEAGMRAEALGIVFVAPDDPLVLGMVDELNKAGFKTMGPRKNAAILEGSKVFSKSFMKRHNIPTAAYKAFTDPEKAITYIKSQSSYPTVIKCDGLALGKGVIIANNLIEAEAAVNSMLLDNKFGDSGKEIVIEEYLDGMEVTVLAFTDGITVKTMPASTDHKRALDNDEGLNTGGMGVVANVPYYTDEIASECMEKIFLPTIRGMAQENRPFKGCIYFGLMLTSKGAKVIEYNCRFGDPETQAILPLLETDLLDIIEAIWEERLADLEITFSDEKSACVVMASGGYPEKYETGYKITGLDEITDVYIYHAGTKTENGELVTAGGRVLGITAVADDLKTALDKAYEAVEKIQFKNAHYRTDIGRKALL
ncbi:MAG: phosphoribosylamine--glycine ligase [Oscillospiraceae bacterium]|nr:phosphoribosylamine--glycine ligase [Oscillospiraceae bacterium]